MGLNQLWLFAAKLGKMSKSSKLVPCDGTTGNQLYCKTGKIHDRKNFTIPLRQKLCLIVTPSI